MLLLNGGLHFGTVQGRVEVLSCLLPSLLEQRRAAGEGGKQG